MVTRTPLSVILFAVVTIGVNILGFFYPNNFTWGFHFLGFLPIHFVISYLLLAIVLLWFFLRSDPTSIVNGIAGLIIRRPYQFVSVILIIVVVSAILFRVKAPLLGDSFYLVKNFSEASRGTSPLELRNEPLATVFLYSMMKYIGASSYEGFLNSFLIADLLLCIGFIINLFAIVRTLFDRGEDQLVAFLFLMVIPYIQLFFGYVETYAVLLYALSLYTLTAVRYLIARGGFVTVVLSFLLMVAVHYTALIMAPSMFLLLLRERRERGMPSAMKGLGIIAGTIVVLLLLMKFEVYKFTALVPHSHFLSWTNPVDLNESYSEAYTMFSRFHGIDLLNFFILLCAGSLGLLVIALPEVRGLRSWTPEMRFLAATVVPVLVVLSVIKFDLGAAKDWDVLAPYGLLIAMFAILLFIKTMTTGKIQIALAVTSLSLLNTAAFLSVNASVQPSIRRYTSLLDERTTSQLSYYTSSLHLAQFYHQINDAIGPITTWERYNTTFPDDPRGYQNIIRNLENFGDSSQGRIVQTYDRWIGHDPKDTTAIGAYYQFCIETGNRKYAAGSLREAEKLYERATHIDSLRARAYNNLGSVYASQGNHKRAIDLFQKAIELEPDYPDPFYNMSHVYEDLGNRTKALESMKRAAELGSPTARKQLQKQGIEW